MQLLIHFYPAIAATLSLYFYKRDSLRMQTFYRRMATYHSARALFVLLTMLAMLIFNFSFLQCFGISIVMLICTIITYSLLWFRFAESVLYHLQYRIVLAFIFPFTLSCVIFPNLWPLSMNLYLLMIAALFYPSRKLRNILEDPARFTIYIAMQRLVIPDYYAK